MFSSWHGVKGLLLPSTNENDGWVNRGQRHVNRWPSIIGEIDCFTGDVQLMVDDCYAFAWRGERK